MIKDLDEEGRTILRQVVERMAYRQLMAINIRGHCLKFLGSVEAKLRVTEEQSMRLVLFREVRQLYTDLGFEHLESAVRDRMERIPYPQSRLEFAVSRLATDPAQRVAMRSYEESACPELAAIAKSWTELALEPGDLDREEEERFVEFASDSGNRPHAQQMFGTWLGIALLSFGRPNSKGAGRAVALGLRQRTTPELIREYLDEMRPLMERAGLALPDLESLGVVLPAELIASLET